MANLKPIRFAEARRAGAVRYFTGRPCKYGHVAERFVSTRHCVTCAIEKAAKWKRDNPEKHSAQKAEWVRRNPERHKAIKAAWARAHPEAQARRSREWFLNNREKACASTLAWVKNNPGKRNAAAARQRADWLQRTPAWADLEKIEAIYTQAREMRDAGEIVEVDHVIPLRGKVVSGLHVDGNLAIIPASRNRVKSNHFNFLEI